MTKGRRTIQRDSVLRRTGGEPQQQSPAQGIEPEDNPNRQTAVWLSDNEVEWLDYKLAEIKRGGWRGVSRSALIRAIIQSAKRSDDEKSLTLAGVSAEEEITQRLVTQINRASNGGPAANA
mgnify:CR=1 FL=1